MRSALPKVVSMLLLSLMTAMGVLTAQPTFTSTPVTTATVGSPYAYGISATDPSNNTLNFSALNIPSWLTLNNNGQSSASQFGGTVSTPGGIAGDDAGNIYVTTLYSTVIYKIAPDGTTTTWATRQNGYVYGMFVYNNSLYVSYYSNYVTNRSKITKINLSNPGAGETDVYVHPSGNSIYLSMTQRAGFLYVAAYGLGKVQKIDLSNNAISDVISSISGPFGLGFSSAGLLYVASYSTGSIYTYNLSTNTLTQVVTGLQNPSDVKIDAYDNVYVSGNQFVRKYTPNLSSFITVYSAPSWVWGMSITPTGALVFGDHNANRVAKLQTGASLTGTPPLSALGVNNVSLRVTNGTTTADQNFTITVYSAPTISAMPNISRAQNLGPITLTNPTSNSSGAFTYTSSNPSIVSVSGNNLILNAQGTVTITANQAASGFYNAGSTTFTVTVTAPVSDPAGALNFVKTNNSYITVPHSSTLNLGAEFTIEAWVNYTGVNSTIIDKGNYNYLLQVNCNNAGFAPNKLNFYNRNTGWVHSAGTVPEGVWTHVAVTLKNGTMTFYINGVASGTAAVNVAQDTGPVNIGRQSPTTCQCNVFNGNMDELRVWNRALSACEINANKSCELTGAQTALAAYYKFNQGNINFNNSAVNTLIDASGNNNTGTLTNFALTGTTANWVAGQVSGTCATYTAPNASITGNLIACAGATTQLSNTITGGVWSSNNTAVATVSANGLVTGLSGGTAIITYTNNCGGVSTATVTINASPTASINASGSTTLCAGSAITLNANTGAGLTYQWRLNGNVIASANNPSYIANAAGSYTVDVTQNGCSATSNALVITPDQTPPVAVCKDVNLVLNASGTASIIIPATTTTLIYEDWSADNQGYYANTSTLNWNVTGDIDRADYVAGMPGIEIDLSGFGNGAIETKQTFNFTPGTYTISFLQVANTLAGNAVKVDIGSLFSQTFVTGLTISSESATFTVTSNVSAKLKLTQLGTSDPSGSFVGQIRLVKNEAATLAIENGSTDNCSIASITASKTNFTCSDIGTNIVTLTVTDVNGNVSTCQATVTVTDNTAPVLSALPSNITLNATSASGAIVNYATPTATDNCAVTVSLTSGLASGSTFPIGNTTVTYTATDAGGNTTSGSFTVTVSGLAPVIVCPSNITVNSAAAQCGANVNFAATETTGIPASVITYSHAPGSFFPVGTTTVTATATNAVGTTTCTFTVTVRDITPPVLACSNQSSSTPVNFMRGTSVGGTAAIVAWAGLNGASQYAGSSLGSSCNESWRPFGTLCDEAPNTNSMTTSTKTNANSGITFNTGGANSIGAFVVDLGATQTFNLAQVYQMFSDGKTTHVRGFYHSSNSTTAPSITDAGWIEMFPETLVGPGAISGNNVTQPTEITFNTTSARYVRFYVRNDGRYGSGTWIETRSIKLFSTAPAVNNVIVTTADGECNATATYDVQATDNCSGTVVTYSIPSGSSFPIGTTPVQVTATDASGNSTTCSFSVIVNAPEINVTGNTNNIPTGSTTTSAANNTNFGGTLPNITVSKNFVIQNTGTAPLKINTINVSGIDASAFSITGITLPVTIAPNAIANFNVVFNSNTPGIKNATITINNSDCNEAAYQFDITAEITCTNPVFVNTNPQVQATTTTTTCNAVVNYPLSVNGIPAPALSYTFSGATTGSGSGTGTGKTFNIGTTRVTVTAVNPCNTVVYEFDVIVRDVTAPNAIAQNVTINLNASGTASITAAQVNNGSSDNCGIATMVLDKTNFDCSNVGVNTVTLTVTDVNGNSSTTTATVTVVDNIAPTAIAQNLTINLNANGTASITAAQVNNGSSDNCGITTMVLDKTNFDCSNVGANTVTLTVTDVNGNSSAATATVTVVDNIAPTAIAQNLTINLNANGTASIAAAQVNNGSSDNCGIATIALDKTNFDCSNVGVNTVTLTVTDVNGNSSTTTATVTVVDNIAPTITAPANINQGTDAGVCGATITLGTPITADNCSIANVGNNAPALFPVGTTVVTWTVTDANGNSSTATQTVIISDTEKPRITAPALVSVVNTTGTCSAPVDLGTPLTSDNCGVATVTNNAPSLFPVGTTIVTWTVTDIHGNITDTAKQTVIVIDNELPTISVSNINVNNDPGKCGATIVVPMPTTGDNCGVASVMGIRSDNKLLTEDYPVGATTISWTVRDVNGNTKTIIQNIQVTDNEKPNITCTPNQVFCANTGGNTQYTIATLNQSDNCGIASTTFSITGATNRSGTGTNASGNFAIGTSTVTFTVTDIHGNVSTCSFTVTIHPLPVASIVTASPNALCNQFVLTANSTLNAPFTYQWLYNNNTKATTQQLSLGLSDADGIYSVYTTDANGCRSELPATYNYQKQNLVSSYTILGTKEVKLGQYNKVETGSVGVMNSRGEAEFDKYSAVTGSGSFVKAPKIDTDKGVTITNKIFGVASVTLPTMQYNLSNTRYLQDKTVNSNTTATVSGNYDEVTLKKGSNVTLTGTVFGKIKLEEGASVRFTSTTIDVEEIQIEKGPKTGGYSYIRFAPNTSIRVSKKVTIGSDVIVNPEAYQVTFYMADNRRDEEKFHVKGDDTRITANIMVPDGKLKVTGGNYGDDKCDHRSHSSKDCKHKGHGHHDCDHRAHGDRDCRDDVFMTGLFIAEEVESEGKNVIWNSYNCSTPSVPVTAVTSNNSQATIIEENASGKLQTVTRTEEELKVTVMPNPTRTYFTLKLESKYDAPVMLRVMDASGRVVDSRAKLGSNSTVQIGHTYQTGNYFAEFTQGNRRKVIQLIKMR